MSTLDRHLAVDADTAFRTITDLDRLPEWNDIIARIVDRPAALVPGSEWVVEMRALGQTWHSRSRLIELDPDARRFAYRSATDDGNPSYAEWTWTVRPSATGCDLTVAWNLNPKTFWRRLLLVRIRSRQLARTELPGSIAALEAACLRSDDGITAEVRPEERADGG